MDKVAIKNLQGQIIELLHQYGARLTYEKDYDWIAAIRDFWKNQWPILNIEALLLGEKFGVLIGSPPGSDVLLANDKYRIFQVTNFEQFALEFNTFVKDKLAQ